IGKSHKATGARSIDDTQRNATRGKGSRHAIDRRNANATSHEQIVPGAPAQLEAVLRQRQPNRLPELKRPPEPRAATALRMELHRHRDMPARRRDQSIGPVGHLPVDLDAKIAVRAGIKTRHGAINCKGDLSYIVGDLGYLSDTGVAPLHAVTHLS